ASLSMRKTSSAVATGSIFSLSGRITGLQLAAEIVDLFRLGEQILEPVERPHARGIAQGLGTVGMGLDKEHLAAGRQSRARQGRHKLRIAAGRIARRDAV